MHPVEENYRMLTHIQPSFLLASGDPDLLQAVEPLLSATGARVSIVLSAEAALAAMRAQDPPTVALLDERLPGMPADQLLAAARAGENPFSIVQIADSACPESLLRLREGVIDDLIPRDSDVEWWRLRIELALRTSQRAHEAELLRSAMSQHAQFDALTGAYNRSTLLSLLFRETDRVQRMSTALCGILLDVDDFGHWNSRLGSDDCDELLVQAVLRIKRLLRSYDILGRVGSDEFLIALPGCTPVNAVLLAERIREAFTEPFHVAGLAVRLSACFAVASSQGRSPIVMLRELEAALIHAKERGPETIQSAADCPSAQSHPVAFLSASSTDDLLAW
jgi:two-component system cell cycle response regulator